MNESSSLLRKKSSKLKPKENVGCWSSLFFSWLNPLLQLGSEKPLEFDDLYPLRESQTTAFAARLFDEQWNKEKVKAHPSVFFALIRANFPELFWSGLLRGIRGTLLFVNPLVLKQIIAFIKDPEAEQTQGYILVGIIAAAGIATSMCIRHYTFLIKQVGMKFKSSITTKIYQKSLVLSNNARSKRSMGEITNLMAVDATRLQKLTIDLHSVWVVPYLITISCLLLAREIGISFLAGIAVMLVVIPFTLFITKLMKRLQKRLMSVKDKRIKKCYEVLSGIKVVKYQTWESPFVDSIMRYRKEEVEKFKSYIYLRSLSSAIFNGVPSFVAAATFGVYVLLGNPLDVGTALTSLALFNVLRYPLLKLPQTVNAIIEANVSLKRIRQFFMEDEMKYVLEGDLTTTGIRAINANLVWKSSNSEDDHNDNTSSNNNNNKGTNAVTTGNPADKTTSNTDDSTASKAEHIQTKYNLNNISFDLQSNHFYGIIGSVGSGKSTLLSGILGDAECVGGSIYKRGTIAYVSQLPFIQNATVRDNICFSLPYDHAMYQNAIHCSCFIEDLQTFPDGDLTEIGEKGINLSGGQKTRIALARAVYQDSDIYLLDDVFAAVDNYVGNFIFQNCVRKALRKKLVILVTNNVNYMKDCDDIFVLDNRTIVEKSTFEGIMQSSTSSKQLLSVIQTLNVNDDDDNSVGINDAVSANTKAAEIDQNEQVQATTQLNTKDANKAELESPPKKHIDSKQLANNKITESDMNKQQLKQTKSLISKEDREIGNVSWQVYAVYIKVCGGFRVALLLCSVYIIAQGLTVSSTVWLSLWSQHAAIDPTHYYLYIFLILNFSYVIIIYLRAILLYVTALNGSTLLFRRLLRHVLYAIMEFYDTTPLGRIINRLSKDIYAADEDIPSTVGDFIAAIAVIVYTIGTIVFVTPLFSLVFLPIGIMYVKSQRYYIKTSRELQRIDAITRSPVFSNFTETLEGLPTIRALQCESHFILKNQQLVDNNLRPYFLNFAINCWLSIRLEFAGTLVSTMAALLAVINHGLTSSHTTASSFPGTYDQYTSVAYAGMVGVSLSYAFSITRYMNLAVTTLSNLETQMVSIERIDSYIKLPTEEDVLTTTTKPVTSMEMTSVDITRTNNWPSTGSITFRNVQMQYRKGLPMVLHNIDFKVQGCTKLGIAGRTGSGKSSLIAVLMRLVNFDGEVCIDNVNITTVPLHTLRSKISIIPQDPVLFSGTIRFNIDPFHVFNDDEIWYVLKRIRLHGLSIQSLDDIVDERGVNYSVGERQLLCIARAMLQKCRIIVMDEATSAMDMQTDQLIQDCIKYEFKDCTCLTIAHRLNTIMDCDYIVVLQDGLVKEYDKPASLMHNRSGLFYALVNEWKE